ncbi:MAG TPA: hypothetical protein DCM86_09115 [Verrucomicrobiales bacterium]|nr:hypothetical protein [Verrucomicrobiales bacterium]
MLLAASAIHLSAQQITPVWYQHINGLYNVAPGDKLPTLVKTPTGGSEASDGSSTFDSYAKFARYSDDLYLLGIRENGINEGDANLTDEQKAIAAAYPDRSIVWIDAHTGKPLGVALTVPVRPMELPAGNNSPDFFWEWAVDEGAYGEKVIYSSYRYHVLRWAPTGTTTDAKFPKGRPTWSNTYTDAWIEPVPGEPNPTITPGEQGTEPGESNGDGSGSWRLKAFRVSGHGATTKLWAGGATWRSSLQEQEFVTDDQGMTFRPIARLNDRNDHGGDKGHYSLGGQPSSIRSDAVDPTRPNLEWCIQGHYPGTGWPARPNRYIKNPSPFVLDSTGVPVDNVRSNRFDSTWGADTDAWAARENQAIGNLPPFTWESAGTAGICGPVHATDGVDHYDGNWSLVTDTKDGLDYIVSYSMPSWNNQFEPIKKPAWLGVHTLDGRIAPGKSSQKLDFVENDEDDAADNGDKVGTDWIYDGSLEVYPDATAPAGTQRALVLWVGSGSGFGVSVVENVAATGTTTGPANLSADAGHSVTLSGTFSGAGTPLLYQFQKQDGGGHWVDVAGSWGNLARFGTAGDTVAFTIGQAKVSDSGTYRFWVGNSAGKVYSASATLTVVADTTAPKVVSAGSVDGSAVDVAFNEAVDPASAAALANYKLSGGATATEAVVRPNGKSVRLGGVSGLAATFTVTVTGVADTAGNAIGAAGSSASGSVLGLTAVDVNVPEAFPGTSAAPGGDLIEVEAGGGDLWGAADSFHYVYSERAGDFDVKVQILDNTQPSNRNGIMARETTDASSRNILQAWSPGPGYISSVRLTESKDPSWYSGARNWIQDCSPNRVNITPPNVWVRLKRHGSTFSGYHSTDGVNWVLDGTSDNDLTDPILLGLATDVGGNGSAYAHTTYAHFSDVTSLSIGPGATAGELSLSWTGAGVLQSASSVTGPWTDTAKQGNPQTLTVGGTTFYRLR